jgi:hypothetical protein
MLSGAKPISGIGNLKIEGIAMQLSGPFYNIIRCIGVKVEGSIKIFAYFRGFIRFKPTVKFINTR